MYACGELAYLWGPGAVGLGVRALLNKGGSFFLERVYPHDAQ